MKLKVRFIPFTPELKAQLGQALQPQMSADDYEDYVKYFKTYEAFTGYAQLDEVFLLAELSIEGTGEIAELVPYCSVDQYKWQQLYNEPDMQISPVDIPLQLLLPTLPFRVDGAATLPVLMRSKNNLWDCCKDLPDWVWKERKFDFMLSFVLKTSDGQQFESNGGGEYASCIVKW